MNKLELIRLASLSAAALVTACGSTIPLSDEEAYAQRQADAGQRSASGYCAKSFVGGDTDWSCINCGGVDALDDADNFSRAIDNRASTGRAFTLGSPGGMMQVVARAKPGKVFDAGSLAGVLVRYPSGTYLTVTATVTAYRDGQQVSLTSVGGENTVVGNIEAGYEDVFYSTVPAEEFDSVELTSSITGQAGPAEIEVKEFCGDL